MINRPDIKIDVPKKGHFILTFGETIYEAVIREKDIEFIELISSVHPFVKISKTLIFHWFDENGIKYREVMNQAAAVKISDRYNLPDIDESMTITSSTSIVRCGELFFVVGTGSGWYFKEILSFNDGQPIFDITNFCEITSRASLVAEFKVKDMKEEY